MKIINKNLFLLSLGAAFIIVLVLSFLFLNVPKQRAASIPGRSTVYSLAYDTMIMLSNSGPETLNTIKGTLSKS